MTRDDVVLVSIDGRIATVTLNQPDRLNALSDRMLKRLGEVMDELAETDTRCVVIKGAGRAFSAGYDAGGDAEEIGYAHTRTAVDDRNRQLKNIDVFLKIWRHPVPVIAQVHGYCMAGGSQLCVFADITMVAEDTIITASPSLPIGGGYISPLWATVVSPKHAKVMSFDAGHRITGATAALWGWATEAVPADELQSRVDDLARSIAKTPASILQMKKEGINRVLELQSLITIARMGTETDTLVHQTPEARILQEWITTDGLKAAIARFQVDGL
jgi:enoyl-CoA hydratase